MSSERSLVLRKIIEHLRISGLNGHEVSRKKTKQAIELVYSISFSAWEAQTLISEK